jgi:hypothetical protein
VGAGAKQDQLFHVRQRALDVAFVGREVGRRLMGKDVARRAGLCLAHGVEITISGSGLLRVAGGSGGVEYGLDRIESEPKRRSMKMGWPPNLAPTPRCEEEALRPRDAGEPMHGIAKWYNVGDSTNPGWAE